MADDEAPREAKTITTSELLRKIRRTKYKAALDLAEEAERERGPLTCGRGCAECCRQKVLLTESEALGIFLYLRLEGRWTANERARLALADEDMRLTSHKDWFIARKPCPFLGAHDECTIHPVRPLACMATFSSAGDPKLCAETDPEKHGTYVVGGEGPASKDLSSLLGSLPNVAFRTIAGAVLVAGAMVEGREPPKVAELPVLPPRAPDEVIEAFDALGNRIILVGA